MDAFVLTAGPLIVGYGLDLALGDPRWLPHPVVAFGRTIAGADAWLNRGQGRFAKGVFVAAGLTLGVYGFVGQLDNFAAQVSPLVQFGFRSVGVFFALANRTLVTEGRAVFAALDADLMEGRRRLSWIVGRDTERLDAQEIRTAVFETMSENLSDGVVAPLFYYALLGVPGMLAYKMVNTLDSMIGHKDERYLSFGKAAARLDDLANLVPARLTALLMVLVTASPRGFRFILRYGRAHDSPNSGYPEAALAGILGVRFGGAHCYDGEWIEKPWIGETPRWIASEEIRRVARINHAVCVVTVVLIVAIQWFRRYS